jgi:hypothetical protein
MTNPTVKHTLADLEEMKLEDRLKLRRQLAKTAADALTVIDRINETLVREKFWDGLFTRPPVQIPKECPLPAPAVYEPKQWIKRRKEDVMNGRSSLYRAHFQLEAKIDELRAEIKRLTEPHEEFKRRPGNPCLAKLETRKGGRQ